MVSSQDTIRSSSSTSKLWTIGIVGELQPHVIPYERNNILQNLLYVKCCHVIPIVISIRNWELCLKYYGIPSFGNAVNWLYVLVEKLGWCKIHNQENIGMKADFVFLWKIKDIVNLSLQCPLRAVDHCGQAHNFGQTVFIDGLYLLTVHHLCFSFHFLQLIFHFF